MAAHETAVVEKGAEIGLNVEIGPFALIEAGAVVGDGTRVLSHAVVKKHTILGSECVVGHGVVLGGEPQDVKFQGETSYLEIGDKTVFREFATAHRADGEGNKTVIGSGCMIMANCHIAHNCAVGDGVTMANLATLGGFSSVGERAFIGGLAGLHQFCRVGAFAMVGGGSVILEDVPPYMMVAGGHRPPVCGLNTVGLMRANFSPEARRNIRLAYRILYKQGLTVEAAVQKLKENLEGSPEVKNMINFLESTTRGISSGRQSGQDG